MMQQDNTITHIEIPAPDLSKAISFYSQVFNWKIEIVSPNSYAYFSIGSTGTGGGLSASLKPVTENLGPQIVVDVADIDQALREVNLAGGSTTRLKTKISGGHGYYACFKDPNGNHLQIHSHE